MSEPSTPEAGNTATQPKTPTARKTFRTLLFADAEEKRISDESAFDLVIRLSVLESVWEQVNEIFSLTKSDEKTVLEFCIEGLLGRKSIQHIRELLEHGDVMWKIPANLADKVPKIDAKHTLSVVACGKP